MAEPFDTLMEVQQHDTALDQLRHRRQTLPEQAELAKVQARRSQIAAEGTEVRTQVDDLKSRQASLEEQIAAATKRRHEIEQRMLTGGVSASRDLQAMDGEVHHLAERQAQLEELELELVDEEDPLDVALEANETAAALLEADATRLQGIVSQEVARIDRAIVAEEAQRAEQAVRLPPDLAEQYEKLRAHLGGVGAARLVGDRCNGCHLTLPSKEVERIRRLPADEFATCDQCGRILVH
ncbi:MAG TPA: C4-type zinc ribbon domain-containing protein [Acidimicrobiales bacterium]|nr:C4-type zinc ribbon domain-containing protein [Acidimicrobiales bacterium]